MGSTFTLGKIRGIAIGVNYTWLIALALITWSLAEGFFPVQFPGWNATTYWLVSFCSTLLLFGSVLVHELTHSFVAQNLGMRVQSISLFVFGGVSNIEGEAPSARAELVMAGVGPLSSLVLGVIFGLAFFVLGDGNSQVAGILLYLALVNVLLAVFNLIPGFPLDGGRVFRAIIWSMTKSFRKATRIAWFVGRAIAYLFVFGGLYVAFTGSFISGVWLAIVGWFLGEAANSSYQQMSMQEALRGVHVAQIMDDHPITVEARTSLDQVVHDHILGQSLRVFPVLDGDRLVGLLTLDNVRAVPANRWAMATAGEVMTSLSNLRTVSPQDEVSAVINALSQEDAKQVPVVENGHLVGLFSRGSVQRFLQVRQELGHGSQA